MDDKINSGKNQPIPDKGPIFETISVEPEPQQSAPANASPEPMAEEIPADVSTPEEVIVPQAAPGIEDIPVDTMPPNYSDNRSKFLIIAGGAFFFIVVLFFIMRLLLGGGAKKENVTLTYWGLWEDKEVMTPLINEYQSKNKNIKINYEKMSPESYREKLIARTQNGQGPDIFRFHNSWLMDAGIQKIAAPLPAKIMSNSQFEKTFFPIHQSDLRLGEGKAYQYYGIPLEVDGLVLLYNEELLKKGGFTKPPAHVEEWPNYVEKLTSKDSNGNLLSSAVAIGTSSNIEYFSDIFGVFLKQNGGDIKNLTQPEAVGALESYRKFSEQGFWDETMPNSIPAFIQQKVAMIIVPSWEILTIKNANPDIALKVASIPPLPGENPISLASYWVEGVSKASKNQIEAWKFLAFLAQKDSMTKLFENESKSRLFGEPYSRQDLADTLSKNEYLKVIMQQASLNQFVTLPLNSRTSDNGINDEIRQYIENAINTTIQGVTYQEAMATAQRGVEQVFEKFKAK